MTRRFKVIIERENEGGYHASVPELPGCHTQGETLKETFDNTREAIILYLESMGDGGSAGSPAPRPTPPKPPELDVQMTEPPPDNDA